jgi:hypothetical protein
LLKTTSFGVDPEPLNNTYPTLLYLVVGVFDTAYAGYVSLEATKTIPQTKEIFLVGTTKVDCILLIFWQRISLIFRLLEP